MKLTEQQQQVFGQLQAFMKSDASVFILQGYAGTGKTTMIKQIADFISKSHRLFLMAPTGRAAQVLAKKTGYEASTIHKAIYNFNEIIIKKEVSDIADSDFIFLFPITVFNDNNIVAIVDEASMLCSKEREHELFQFGTDNLMNDLLTFVRPSFGGKVIFVGDPAQLPPVGEPKSQALEPSFFEDKGYRVMQATLTEVIRQDKDSTILKNSMQIRNLLNVEKRNHLVLEEKDGEVESLPIDEMLGKYLETRKQLDAKDSLLICYSNMTAAKYNANVRASLYGEKDAPLRVGDIVLLVHNNYYLDRMNGEILPILQVGEKTMQSAPVYVQENGQKVRKIISLEFQSVKIANSNNEPIDCMILLNLLYNGSASITIDEHRALYINFCMRNPQLKQGTTEFANALKADKYYNCLKAKFGYAITGHKCQGGEWKKVFVDFTSRTGLNDDCLRWIYTAITRARETLYIVNLPHITPFSKFRIEPIQQCSKINEECRIIGEVEHSPYHEASAPNYLHAKYWCIKHYMEGTPYSIESVISKPYQEIYNISTPNGIERYDIRYKKGGIFMKAIPQIVSGHSAMVNLMLDDERIMPIVFNYIPSTETHDKLYKLIQSACDGHSIQITNIVEHKEDFSVVYYLRTSNTMSYIKLYIDGSGFVTYAKPMSLIGNQDYELKVLIEEIQNHFE